MTVEPLARTRPLLFLRPEAALAEFGDRLLDHPTIVLDDTRIAAVERRPIEPADGVPVVDLPGVTLLPGLIDIHTHLIFDTSGDPVDALAARTDEQALDSMVVAAGRALRAGITTVRDLGDRSYLASAVTAHAGEVAMPTIVAAGPPITSPGGHCHFLGASASGIDGLRASVAEHSERGVDVIKVMASGGHTPEGSDPVFRRLHAAGATVAVGTDAGLDPGRTHDVLPCEMAMLASIGMTNAEVLHANTAVAARAIGLGTAKGRISAGFDADLLAVLGNPLKDSGRLLDVAGVFKAGRAVVTP